MEERMITCICCPLGCMLTVTLEGGRASQVTGNTCKRGEDYGKKEVICPTRMVTTTVPIEGGEILRLPVKTKEGIPKEKIFACMEALKGVRVRAPVSIGELILSNAAGTGVDIVAARSVWERDSR